MILEQILFFYTTKFRFFPEAKVYAFEPQREVNDRFRKTIDINHLQDWASLSK